MTSGVEAGLEYTAGMAALPALRLQHDGGGRSIACRCSRCSRRAEALFINGYHRLRNRHSIHTRLSATFVGGRPTCVGYQVVLAVGIRKTTAPLPPAPSPAVDDDRSGKKIDALERHGFTIQRHFACDRNNFRSAITAAYRSTTIPTMKLDASRRIEPAMTSSLKVISSPY